jgi:hypothetical protein
MPRRNLLPTAGVKQLVADTYLRFRGGFSLGTKLGLALLIPAGVVAYRTHPADPAAFYNATAQIIPVFLVALAVEQTITQSLGTESSYINEAESIAARNFRVAGAAEELQRTMHQAVRQWARDKSFPPNKVKIPVRSLILDSMDGFTDLPLSDQWEIIAASLEKRYDPDDPNSVERMVERLAAMTYLGEPGMPLPGGAPGASSTTGDVLKWLETAYKAFGNDKSAEYVREVGDAAKDRYRMQRRQRRVGTVSALVLLAIAEALALTGLITQPRCSQALFAVTCALLASAVAMVIAGAIRALFD